MTRPQRIAHGLIAKHGIEQAFWLAMRRVRGWICDGTDLERVRFWSQVRNTIYETWGHARYAAAFHGAAQWH